MWIWWIISFIILIACVIFAYRMIASSYEFLPADKRFFSGLYKNPFLTQRNFSPPDENKILKNNVQRVQDNTAFYDIQFSKIQQRLKALEELYTLKSLQETSGLQVAKEKKNEEDWEEMYYEENSSKEKLENELDFAKQALENAENKLNEYEGDLSKWNELQSDYETRLNDLQSLQNEIDLLNRQLRASAEREDELEQLLFSEITMREKYSMLQKDYIRLLSEADDLRKRSSDTNKKHADLQIVLKHQRQLESYLAICKEENFKLKADLENLINHNHEYQKS